MRSFAKARIAEGHHHYLAIDGPSAGRPMMEVLQALVSDTVPPRFVCKPPNEWRLDEMFREAMNTWPETLGVSVSMDDTEHFLTGRTDLADHSKARSSTSWSRSTA